MPVVGVSVVCAVPNGTFIALAPRSLHLAEFRHPQFIAPLRLTFLGRGEGEPLEWRHVSHIYYALRLFIKFFEHEDWKQIVGNLIFEGVSCESTRLFFYFRRLTFLCQFFSMARNEDISSLVCIHSIIIFQNDSPWCASNARGKKGMDH